MTNGTPLVRHSLGEGGSRADQLVTLAGPAIQKLTGADLIRGESFVSFVLTRLAAIVLRC
jgi:hypothetical protein